MTELCYCIAQICQQYFIQHLEKTVIQRVSSCAPSPHLYHFYLPVTCPLIITVFVCRSAFWYVESSWLQNVPYIELFFLTWNWALQSKGCIRYCSNWWVFSAVWCVVLCQCMSCRAQCCRARSFISRYAAVQVLGVCRSCIWVLF